MYTVKDGQTQLSPCDSVAAVAPSSGEGHLIGKSELAAFFDVNQYERIGIYGRNKAGLEFYESLRREGIKVDCFVDRRPGLPGLVDAITLVPVPNLPLLDVLVVADAPNFAAIQKALATQVSGKIVSLEGLASCLDDLSLTFSSMARRVQEAGAEFHIVRYTRMWELDHFSDYELALQKVTQSLTLDFMKQNPKHLQVVCGDLPGYSDDYIANVFTGPPVIKKGGVLMHADFQSQEVNVVNGVRLTTDVPADFDHSLHILGQCVAYGLGTDDAHTIASYLQRFLNRDSQNGRFRVVNHGVWGCDDRRDYLSKLRNISLQPGDIVVLIDPLYRQLLTRDAYRFFANRCEALGIGYFDLYHLFNRPHDFGEVFVDCHHLSHNGFKQVAARLKEICVDKRRPVRLKTKLTAPAEHAVAATSHSESELENSPKFLDFLASLRKVKIKTDGTVGAIVMNCNPFTLGHKYLAQRAAEQVAVLYLFVVQEDKSFFPFPDRFKLVEQGVREFNNIVVIPSGQFIISNITFPEYFSKDNPDTVAIDPSADIELFGKHIAPALEISVRFAGQEPFCVYTNQYNQTMRTVLPKYGVSFLEIPRMESGGEAISASKVRRLLKDRNFDEIGRIVPASTLEYLKARFGEGMAVGSPINEAPAFGQNH